MKFKNYIVLFLQATFALEKGNHAEIKAQMDELTELRELEATARVSLLWQCL